MAELLRVGEAAKVLGVTAKTLRFYEQKGVLPPARRNGAGYRLYAAEDLERARFILRLKAMGLVLQEAREVLACAEEACCGATGPRLEETLRSKLAEVESRILELKALRRKLMRALDGEPGPELAEQPGRTGRSGRRGPGRPALEATVCFLVRP